MGKFYARLRGQADDLETVGIDLTDMTTGVGVFILQRGQYVSVRLTPDEAEAFADELRRVAQFVRDDNA